VTESNKMIARLVYAYNHKFAAFVLLVGKRFHKIGDCTFCRGGQSMEVVDNDDPDITHRWQRFYWDTSLGFRPES
jgi:hypothetical protein